MPRPDEALRAAVALPLALVRRLPGGGLVAGLVEAILPGGPQAPEREDDRAPRREDRVARNVDLGTVQAAPGGTAEADPESAAEAALERKREPAEEPGPGFEPDPGDEHLEAEVELVAESADLEATEPPGPQLHVDEPWEGYRRMKVAEIAARLDGQSPAVLAAVELYETTHRKRRGVLDAVRAASRA